MAEKLNHQDDFLNELTQLTQKYGIAIEGCGCCGSPYLSKIIDEQPDSKYVVDHNNECLKYEGAEHG